MSERENISEQRCTTYRSSKAWEMNVWGAAIAGLGMGALMCAVAGVVFKLADTPSVRVFALAWIATTLAALAALFPGNLIAAVPYRIDLIHNRGLVLHAPLKTLFIPLQEIRAVRNSSLQQAFQAGIVVKLNRRYGLMKSFALHWAFGAKAGDLAREIKAQISPPA